MTVRCPHLQLGVTGRAELQEDADEADGAEGDVAQRLHMDNGFTDWNTVLGELGLAHVAIEPLRLSYRSTQEIIEFSRAVQALYATAYALKFACKAQGRDFVVAPLEMRSIFPQELPLLQEAGEPLLEHGGKPALPVGGGEL